MVIIPSTCWASKFRPHWRQEQPPRLVARRGQEESRGGTAAEAAGMLLGHPQDRPAMAGAGCGIGLCRVGFDGGTFPSKNFGSPRSLTKPVRPARQRRPNNGPAQCMASYPDSRLSSRDRE